jgi:hypothetical protein
MNSPINIEAAPLQWHIDNITYKLYKGEITMAKCTDEILALLEAWVQSSTPEKQEIYGGEISDHESAGYNQGIETFQHNLLSSLRGGKDE